MRLLRNIFTGSFVSPEADQYSKLITLSQGGKLQRAAEEGRLYSIANQAAVATTSALATTWTGLAVGNPDDSKQNLIIHKFGYALSLAGSAAGAVGIMVGATSLTASLIPAKRLASSNPSVAIATAGQTIGTPVLYDTFASYGTEGTDTGLSLQGNFMYDLDGSLILEPGRFVATYTTLATTAAFVFSFLFEEVDR